MTPFAFPKTGKYARMVVVIRASDGGCSKKDQLKSEATVNHDFSRRSKTKKLSSVKHSFKENLHQPYLSLTMKRNLTTTYRMTS